MKDYLELSDEEMKEIARTHQKRYEAICILRIQKCLALNKYDEAYHWLYGIASPYFNKYEPWEELEKIAEGQSPITTVAPAVSEEGGIEATIKTICYRIYPVSYFSMPLGHHAEIDVNKEDRDKLIIELTALAGANSIRQQGEVKEAQSELIWAMIQEWQDADEATYTKEDIESDLYDWFKKLDILPQSPSIPQPGFIEKLREFNPYPSNSHILEQKYCFAGYRECCDRAAELLGGKGEEGITCVFCEMPCEPAPTKRGWSSVRYGCGLHFDCAGKVADQGNTIDMQEEWDQITNHKFKPYDRDESYVDDMGNDPL